MINLHFENKMEKIENNTKQKWNDENVKNK